MVNVNNNEVPSSLLYWAALLILSLIATRLISLGLFPLYDTTEARYSEIARIMLETNNWVTPQFDYNIPFWGKPPFQTWISALSFSWLGINEFSARLPHFICGLITCALIFRFTQSLTNKNTAIYALLIITSSLGFILAIGMVMTDSALLMANTLAMVSYWQCYSKSDKIFYGHLFFFALALGMLIKGPVAIVFIVLSLLCWSLWQGNFKEAIKRLPWLTGMCLFLLLTLPWYIWAEIRTPGFIEYFILGEHIQRFLVSGWQGDLYGTAHVKPRGIIWLYWLICASPWSFVALSLLVKKYRGIELPHNPSRILGINKYLICWMISPLLLFTMAGNILPIYVLPGFSALAVLVAINSNWTRTSNYFALISLVLLGIVIVILNSGAMDKKTEAKLLGVDRSFSQNSQLYYWNKRPFSAQFYSKGQAQLLNSTDELQRMLTANERFLIAIKNNEFDNLKNMLATACVLKKQTEVRMLLQCN
ncbi:ArnT family glycosyltransferase [Cognaticolwellia mytili]|uniref:ArnT family glycosyltransferase n=1 Tax=Cognaticolwellia mytili TaxID=1888913 RepID=UPI000A175CE3|nr:glycosyltransferase family 39 protein [Cognaticolwellia mytili]